eukprot:CAMPEP_0117437322 /NCGR_PEP_ID=MMETSP0759-20121206/1463_1 /TAXON_ID=63605 /ORGANISM="Percolomonas cosmopolitus, Strain WS" /LENGTH=322 /DNA_ID=CAMNT_0005228949 /DNA_START=15 /DNA_END=983 /DNA_ORIENTATION=+
MPTIHISPIFRKYDSYGNIISLLLPFIIYLLCLVLTFVVAFFTGDYYSQLNSYYEQPQATFTQKSILILQTSSGPKVWTSSNHLNSLIDPTQLIQPVFKLSYQQDTGLSRQVAIMRNQFTPNPDAKVDNYHVNMKVHLQNGEEVYGVEYLTYFLLKLESIAHIDMHSVVHLQQQAAQPVTALKTMGELHLKQKTPFNRFHSDTGFNYTSTEFENVKSISELNTYQLVKDFYDREETAIFRDDVNIFTYGKGASQFELDLDVSVPEWIIYYRPDFFESVKHAYVQFVAIGLPIFFIGWVLCQILFAGGILNSKLIDPIKLKRQ